MIKAAQYLFITFFLVTQSCSNTNKSTTDKRLPEPAGENNFAYKWGKISLTCTANDTEKFRPRPTVTSRILALTWTAVFDAWSVYDANATPLYLKATRRPEEERTLENKEIAISYAAYRAMLDFYFSDSTLLRNKMLELGL